MISPSLHSRPARGRLAWICLVLLMAALVCGPRTAHAEVEDTDTSKAVVVAFDNSGSMDEHSNKWCIAQYGLEVLAGMMGSNDTLTVIGMPTADGRIPQVDLQGSQSVEDRVRTIHAYDFGLALHTDANTVQVALNTLESMSADEKYLVITTDGAFSGTNANAQVQAIVNTCAGKGVKAIYLAIGKGAFLIKESEGVSIKKAMEEAEILPTMKETANDIFGRAVLGNDVYDAKTGELELDAPMGTLIVLAQGEGAKAGKLKGKGEVSITPEVAEVKYRDYPFEKLGGDGYEGSSGSELNQKFRDSAQKVTALTGQVGVYSGRMPAGSYTLEAEGSEIEVYYKPYVDIDAVLTNTEGKKTALSEVAKTHVIEEGGYSVSYKMTDPFTHKSIKSKLVGDPAFTLTVKTDNGEVTYGANEVANIDVAQNVSLRTTAELPGHVRVSNTVDSVKAVAELIDLEIDASSLDGGMDVLRFDTADTTFPITIKKANGEAITPDEWKNTDVVIDSDNGLKWNKPKKTKEVGVVEVSPTKGGLSDDDVAGKLLGFFGYFRLPSREFHTSITVNMEDAEQLRPSAGTIDLGADVHSPFWYWFGRILIAALAVLFCVWFVWFWGTWPTLPKRGLQPRLVYRTEGGEAEKVFSVIPYGRSGTKTKKHKKRLRKTAGRLLPRRTQTMRFGPTIIGGNIQGLIKCCTMEVEAVKSKRRYKLMRFSDATIRQMQALRGDYNLPDPEWKISAEENIFYFEDGAVEGTGTNPDPYADSSTLTYEIRFCKTQ